MEKPPQVIEVKPPEQTMTCKEVPDPIPEEEELDVSQATQIVVDIYFAWKDCYQKLSKVRMFFN